MTLFQDIIAKKRDNHALEDDEINAVVQGITDGSADDAQLGAFAMAVLLRGMTRGERLALTTAMRDSGDTLRWQLDAPVLDKHSTGGVGDCVSLILAPALAACGAYVPMISGRGLGHTGGTLDKLDAIPGYRTDIDETEFRRVVRDIGCAIIGQTSDLAPADKRLYAIRDISGTVDSIDLICASILSKKLAAGLDTLIIDVKCGNGAIAKTIEDARELASALVDVANAAACKTQALITDMNEPLCTCAGNALEVAQCVRLLRGDEIDARLWDVTVALGGAALAQAGLAGDTKDGEAKIAEALESGKAAETFAKMVAELGGPSDFLDGFEAHLPKAPVITEIYHPKAGFVDEIDTQALGRAVVTLGGGRRRASDTIDYAVGLDWLLGRGLMVDSETPIARVHAEDEAAAQEAKTQIIAAYNIADKPGAEEPLILDRITA